MFFLPDSFIDFEIMKKILTPIFFSALISLGSCTQESEESQGLDMEAISNALEGKWTVADLMGHSIHDSLLPYGKAFLTPRLPAIPVAIRAVGCFLLGRIRRNFLNSSLLEKHALSHSKWSFRTL